MKLLHTLTTTQSHLRVGPSSNMIVFSTYRTDWHASLGFRDHILMAHKNLRFGSIQRAHISEFRILARLMINLHHMCIYPPIAARVTAQCCFGPCGPKLSKQKFRALRANRTKLWSSVATARRYKCTMINISSFSLPFCST